MRGQFVVIDLICCNSIIFCYFRPSKVFVDASTRTVTKKGHCDTQPQVYYTCAASFRRALDELQHGGREGHMNVSLQKSIILYRRALLKNGYEVLDPISCILSYALGDPSQVPYLLLLQLHIAIEHTMLELLQESLLVQMYLRCEKVVL